MCVCVCVCVQAMYMYMCVCLYMYTHCTYVTCTYLKWTWDYSVSYFYDSNKHHEVSYFSTILVAIIISPLTKLPQELLERLKPKDNVLILPKIHIDHVPNCDRKTMGREKPLACEAFVDLVGARVEVRQRKWGLRGNRTKQNQGHRKEATWVTDTRVRIWARCFQLWYEFRDYKKKNEKQT